MAALAIAGYVVAAAWPPGDATASTDLMSMGQHLATYAGAEVEARPRTLSLNGQKLHLVTGKTADAIDAVLDAFAVRCRRGQWDSRTPFARVNASPPTRTHAIFPQVQEGRASGRGFVACSDPLSGISGFAGVTGLAAGRLPAVPIRYAYAEERAGQAHYLVMWSDGFDVESLSATREVPQDGWPTPDGRLALAAEEEGRPYALRVFSGAPDDPEVVAGRYRRQFDQLGFRTVRLSRERVEQDRAGFFVERAGLFALVTSYRGLDGSTSTLLAISHGEAPPVNGTGAKETKP
jgi:hypothetical protein